MKVYTKARFFKKIPFNIEYFFTEFSFYIVLLKITKEVKKYAGFEGREKKNNKVNIFMNKNSLFNCL